jgi:hypothetical protein
MNNRVQQNNSLNNFNADLFFDNLIANLLASEILNKVSPSRIKSTMSTEFIITKIVEIEQNQKTILSELEEIKKIIKKEE